jgi:hypothetical protein
MLKLNSQQIKEIAENLDCGMKCYLHKKTGEIKAILDFDSWETTDEEPWEDEIREIRENWGDYIEFEKMSSNEAFALMEDYAAQVDDDSLRERFFESLRRPKPFSNFKWIIDHSGEYREKWFEYKEKRYMGWVEDRINEFNDLDRFE